MLLSELTSFVDANRYKGRREAFGIKDTKNYLRWAFLHDYLFVAFDEGRIAGVGVAYPISTPYAGDDSVLNPTSGFPPQESPDQDICIMDWCALNAAGRISLVWKFRQRYPNWENQKKWAVQFDKVVEISNKYINLTEAL
jgi:hypothetical protein